MLKNMPPELTFLIEQAILARPTRETALTALHCLDLTSLNDDDTPEKIAALLARADQKELGHVAAVCIKREFVKQASNALAGKGINVATVINFPSGKGTPAETSAATKSSIADGANEIDIVFDYDSYLQHDPVTPAGLLLTCANACEGKAKLKDILETAAYEDYYDLYGACLSGLAAGADFLKTSTGKSERGGASLEAVAVMLQAENDFRNGNTNTGIKISGGIKTVADAAPYIALLESMRGKDWIRPENFRIGASSLLGDIQRVLGVSKPAAPPTPPSPGY